MGNKGDYFFYLIIAISVISAIAKAFKKKTEVTSEDSPNNPGGDVFRKIFRELQEVDDYIPSSKTPATKMAKPIQVQKEIIREMKGIMNVDHAYDLPEDEHKIKHKSSNTSNLSVLEIEETESFLSNIDLSDVDEMKRAIVYSEILNPKF